MDVTTQFDHPTLADHFIQFGLSTWSQNNPESPQTNSIRRAVFNDGIFSPRGSSEIPIDDVKVLVRFCIENNWITENDIADILMYISESVRVGRRQG